MSLWTNLMHPCSIKLLISFIKTKNRANPKLLNGSVYVLKVILLTLGVH